jgi:hypothetical protein
MHWKKLGHIFPTPEHINNFTHASDPVAEHLQDNIFRIYFASRDDKNRSHIFYTDIEIGTQIKVVETSVKPVLSPGQDGLFDDSGVVPGCITHINGKKYLYYLGWNLGVTVPWRNTIGAAEWNDETNSFIKISPAPVMDRSKEDPFSISYPFILRHDGKYVMWYGSNLGWGKKYEDMKHVIKRAESTDGITWKRTDKICIPLTHKNEYGISRPSVVIENGIFKMWYCFRGQENADKYRMGYAESVNGDDWIRKDESAGIDVSSDGWDSEMICYPFIFDHNDKRYLLYNGNGYGKTGFGIAITN